MLENYELAAGNFILLKNIESNNNERIKPELRIFVVVVVNSKFKFKM